MKRRSKIMSNNLATSYARSPREVQFLALLLFLFFSSFCSAEIYKWTDEKGQVHFSDKSDSSRPSDSVEIKVQINSYESVSYETLINDQENSGQEQDRNVIMYSTSWCKYCAKARRYFEASSIPFTEYDIEKDATAKQEYDELGAKGVPVILVGNKRMNGFSVSGFKAIYN
jgi:glutaredoxin